jgi:hypothetical protein
MFMFRSTHNRIVAELSAKINLLERERNDQSLSQTNLAGTIRNIDQRIFQMSQCTDWESMRLIFNQLQHDCAARQRAESEFIANVTIRQLKETADDRPSR